jgi:hypothetical protein
MSLSLGTLGRIGSSMRFSNLRGSQTKKNTINYASVKLNTSASVKATTLKKGLAPIVSRKKATMPKKPCCGSCAGGHRCESENDNHHH